jgi:hypothetical protein
MTYDQWKTTPPEERWGRPMCHGCDGPAPIGSDWCSDCLAEVMAEEAMREFYQWEPQ